eukprot:scaffold10798_cov44-Prasinocladus_malaysianus.AAC.1
MSVKEIKEKRLLQQKKWKLIEWIVAVLYTVGSVIFVIGSCFFLPEPYARFPHAGAWMFVWGSVLFGVGAIINIMQRYTVTSSLTIQLLNAVAIQFLVGSILFLVASVVYLLEWGPVSQYALDVAHSFAAWLLTVASILFTTGGLSNMARITRSRDYLKERGGKTEALKSQKMLNVYDKSGNLEHATYSENSDGHSSESSSVYQ